MELVRKEEQEEHIVLRMCRMMPPDDQMPRQRGRKDDRIQDYPSVSRKVSSLQYRACRSGGGLGNGD